MGDATPRRLESRSAGATRSTQMSIRLIFAPSRLSLSKIPCASHDMTMSSMIARVAVDRLERDGLTCAKQERQRPLDPGDPGVMSGEAAAQARRSRPFAPPWRAKERCGIQVEVKGVTAIPWRWKKSPSLPAIGAC
jgi:hypothetical protein